MQKKIRRSSKRQSQTPPYEWYLIRLIFQYVFCWLDWCLNWIWPTRKKLKINERIRQLGTFLVGSQGRGKSEFLKHLIWRYVTELQSSSIVLLDPHGELAKQIARWKIHQKNNRLDYIEFSPPTFNSPSFNILDTKDRRPNNLHWESRFYGHALEIVGNNSFSPLMLNLCCNCLHVLLEKPNSTLYDLLDFLDVSKKNAFSEFGANKSVNPVVRHFFRNYSTDDLKATRKALYNRIQPILASPQLQQIMMQGTSFDLAKLINKRRIIIFNFGNLDDKATQMLGQLISAKVQLIAQKRRPHLENIHWFPVIHLILDEAQNFISEMTVTQINELRKCRLHLTLATQDVNYFRQRILNAALSLGVLVAGNCEGQSLKVMAKALGLDNPQRLKELAPGEFFIHQTPLADSKRRQVLTYKKSVPTWLLFDAKHRKRNRRRYLDDKSWNTFLKAQRSHFKAPHKPNPDFSTPNQSQSVYGYSR